MMGSEEGKKFCILIGTITKSKDAKLMEFHSKSMQLFKIESFFPVYVSLLFSNIGLLISFCLYLSLNNSIFFFVMILTDMKYKLFISLLLLLYLCHRYVSRQVTS